MANAYPKIVEDSLLYEKVSLTYFGDILHNFWERAVLIILAKATSRLLSSTFAFHSA